MGQTTGKSLDTDTIAPALCVSRAMDELNKTIRKCEAMRSYIERTRTFSADPHS